MKGLPLAYNSDMQEDKEAFFDSVDTLEAIGRRAAAHARPRSRFRAERMRTAAGENFSTATDLADYLVRKGLPFRDGARGRGQGRPLRARARRHAWSSSTLEELRRFSDCSAPTSTRP